MVALSVAESVETAAEKSVDGKVGGRADEKVVWTVAHAAAMRAFESAETRAALMAMTWAVG